MPLAKNRVFTNYYTNTVAGRAVNSVMRKTFNFWWLESRNLLCTNKGIHYFESVNLEFFYLYLRIFASDGRNPEVLRSGMVYNHTLSAPFCQAMLIFSNSWGTHLFLSIQLGTLSYPNYYIFSYHSWCKVYNWALLKFI